ncbi:hypothetical protein [Holdemanella biformis]|uniref:hypothetical protein n=1 Tax=Holdemanella biformis TaxID=1735 RepID=UPI0022E20BB2|nr:hypothetical protein [Holdemanella biformis]
MKEELNVYGRTIGEEIETKYIRSDELGIRNTNTLQEDIKSSKLYEYVEDIYDKPTSSKFLKLTAYMALNILKGICSIVLPMAAIAFLVFLCSKMGAYSLLSVNIPNTDIVSFSLSVTGFLIFILLGCFSVAIVAVDDFSIPLFFKVVVSVIVLALGILLMNTFMTANDFVSIFFPLFKFSFVLCFLFSALKLFAAFYFVKKK